MKTALVVLALLLPSAASGMLFKWTDSKGITHYTNREYEIPERYRAKARRLYPEQADAPAPQQNQPAQQAARPDLQTPAQPGSPDGQIRPQLPVATSEQRRQEVRPVSGRRARAAAASSAEE
jgi:hypothetical protein